MGEDRSAPLHTPEPLSGYDTTYFHFGDESPMHTLKCLVLDPTRRGRAITLDDVRTAMAPRLALHPRARQRAVRSASLPGRYAWYDDPDFELDRHLGEATIDGTAALDGLCGHLATEQLPLDCPLWHATLVHGLDDGRQALVFRIHHAVMDGVGAANTLRFFTTEKPGEPIPTVDVDEWRPPPIPDERALRRKALAAIPGWGRGLATYVSETVASREERRNDARLIRSRDDLIGLKSEATYGWTGARFGGGRLCARGSLAFDRFRVVKEKHGVTVNDVLVAVVGEAVAAEAVDRGQERDDDELAMFSIALDTDPDRLCGNEIMAISVPMHTKGDDVAERLARIARTNRDQIDLTRRQQDRRSVRITDLWARSFALGARMFAYRIPTMVANVVMANVPGSPTTRWIGDVEVVDFVSYAVLVQPIGVNVTVYSYDGRMNIGLLTAPEVIDDPHRLLRRMDEALDRFANS
ncbi:wax ester/triacylglycerol synthase domain-containing protein [Actinospongicola halichondriae]|uniref:wax ester/triacylglycerol synthase domain-containing protein n=1 Tax=Actinospongicola halichondriae TaxID=3236844 RepID=UPI003D57DB39